MPRAKEYIVDVSGIARGNPGLAGIGVVIRDSLGREVERLGTYLGLATPIQAEYQAVIAGLEAVARRDPERATLRTANETVWRQLVGKSPMRAPDLIDLYVRARELLGGLPAVELRHTSAVDNEIANQVANVVLDSRGRRTAVD